MHVQHLAVASFTPETVGELKFGEIWNCYETNRLPEKFVTAKNENQDLQLLVRLNF